LATVIEKGATVFTR